MEADLSDNTLVCLRQMVEARNLSALLFRTNDKTLLFLYCERKIVFASGLHTIKGILHPATLAKEAFANPFPGMLLRKNFFSEASVLFRAGDYFSPGSVEAHMALAASKVALLMDSSVPLKELVTTGNCEVGEVPNIAHARRHFMEEEKTLSFEGKPDLEGDLVLTFKHYDEAGVPIPGEAPIPVTIVGRPDDIVTKKKHYWVYSSRANYGKSTTLKKELVDNYKAIVVPHVTNAMNIPPNAQFIIFDEYSPAKPLHIEDLQRLTGGDASSGCLNRKSYGISYTPRSDCQFIILSNYSPYEVYSQYNTTTHSKFMSVENYTTINARFNVFRLDGPDLAKKKQFASPTLLTRNEYLDVIKSLMYDSNVALNESDTLTAYAIKSSLTNAYSVYKGRHAGENFCVEHFEIDLKEAVPAVDLAMITNVCNIFKTYDSYSKPSPNFSVSLSGHLSPQDALMFRARKRVRVN